MIQKVPRPNYGLAFQCWPHVDYADAYQAPLPPGVHSVDAVAWRVLGQSPAWVKGLLQLRNTLVRPFRLKTEPPRPQALRPPATPLRPGDRLAIFKVFDRAPDELLLGDDDRHLDFRVSVLLTGSPEAPAVIVSTLVRFNNALGRIYFLPVRPFHALIVPAMMRAGLAGWKG